MATGPFQFSGVLLGQRRRHTPFDGNRMRQDSRSPGLRTASASDEPSSEHPIVHGSIDRTPTPGLRSCQTPSGRRGGRSRRVQDFDSNNFRTDANAFGGQSFAGVRPLALSAFDIGTGGVMLALAAMIIDSKLGWL